MNRPNIGQIKQRLNNPDEHWPMLTRDQAVNSAIMITLEEVERVNSLDNSMAVELGNIYGHGKELFEETKKEAIIDGICDIKPCKNVRSE